MHKNTVEAYIGKSLATPLYINLMGLDIDDFVFSESSMYASNIGFAVNKKRPDLYNALDRIVAEIVADGRFEAILKNYVEKIACGNSNMVPTSSLSPNELPITPA